MYVVKSIVFTCFFVILFFFYNLLTRFLVCQFYLQTCFFHYCLRINLFVWLKTFFIFIATKSFDDILISFLRLVRITCWFVFLSFVRGSFTFIWCIFRFREVNWKLIIIFFIRIIFGWGFICHVIKIRIIAIRCPTDC